MTRSTDQGTPPQVDNRRTTGRGEFIERRVRHLPRERRSERRGRRKRLLIRTVALAVGVVALLTFLHFVALPLSDGHGVHLLGR